MDVGYGCAGRVGCMRSANRGLSAVKDEVGRCWRIEGPPADELFERLWRSASKSLRAMTADLGNPRCSCLGYHGDRFGA